MVKLNQYGTQFSAVHRNNYSDEIIFVENKILWTKLNNMKMNAQNIIDWLRKNYTGPKIGH